MTDGTNTNDQPAAVDYGVVLGALSQDNRTVLERKGFLKDGKPSEGFTLDKVVDSYRGLESLVGKKTLEEPNLADAEAYAAWPGHKLLQVPEKVEDYKFDRPALPDGLKWSEAEGDGGLQWDADGEKQLRAAALKAKVGQPAFQQMMKELATERVGAIVAARAARESEKQLISQNLDQKFGVAKKGALESGDQAIRFIAEKAGLDHNVVKDGLASQMGNEATVLFSIQLGKMLGEDVIAGGKTAGFATSPDAARAQIAAFQADPEKTKALSNRADPKHKAANEEWQRLNALLRPKG